MSDTNKNVDLGKKDELIKKESAFVDLLSMEINKKIILILLVKLKKKSSYPSADLWILMSLVKRINL